MVKNALAGVTEGNSPRREPRQDESPAGWRGGIKQGIRVVQGIMPPCAPRTASRLAGFRFVICW